MADTPFRFMVNPISSKMHPIIPDGESKVLLIIHWVKEKINFTIKY